MKMFYTLTKVDDENYKTRAIDLNLKNNINETFLNKLF